MSERAEKLKSAILELSEVERIEVAAALMDSLPWEPEALSEDDPDLDAVLRRRLDDHLSGRDPGILGDDVFRELREERS